MQDLKQISKSKLSVLWQSATIRCTFLSECGVFSVISVVIYCSRTFGSQNEFLWVFYQLCCHFISKNLKLLQNKKQNRLHPVSTVYALFYIRSTSQDRRPMSLCIHLFPHLLSHSSINELVALHRVKEWLLFIAASLLYFTDIHNTKLPIYNRQSGIQTHRRLILYNQLLH